MSLVPCNLFSMRGLIIGYGNTLRGDDALGALAAERILECEGYEVRAAHQLTVDLADEVSQAAWVIFIDAKEGGVPGTVALERVREATEPPSSFTHYVSPDQLLASARALYGRAPEAWIVTAVAESFEFGKAVSQAMMSAVDEVVRVVETLAVRLSQLQS